MSFRWLELFCRTAQKNIKAERIDPRVKKVLREIVKFGKKEIIAGVRSRYTYKGSVNKFMRSKTSGTSARITVKGARLGIEKFKAKMPARPGYMTVSVLKGKSSTLPRGFQWRSLMMKRVGQPRLPVKHIMGPSAAEMAGHEPTPVNPVMEKINAKVEAELEKMMSEYAASFG